MWPQALQMSRDECRGILRRLELESYSNVISVFRAQGGLSDGKAKLLEELRGIFHISQERHRAEARRVANDEQLATIAEAISGPNTWQEWSREGRRSFPMLPRVAPQTALALIANNIANELAAENAKLPYPADTAAAVIEEQSTLAAARELAARGEVEQPSAAYNVVTSDPFKMPDIPAGPKKNLKRNMVDNHSGSTKKRHVNELSLNKQQQQQQLQHKQYQHITANTNVSPANAASLAAPTSNIKKLYNNNSKLQQQRYFHQQQQLQKQKLANKKATGAAAAATAKRQATPAKSGRKAQKLQEQQQLQQKRLEQQQQLRQQAEHMQAAEIRNAFYGSNDVQRIEILEDVHIQAALPQIAASKKDISKNLSKLQIPIAAAALQMNVTSPTTAATMLIGKAEKQLISTPVQKYIVEDRQPPIAPAITQMTAATAAAPNAALLAATSATSAAVQVVTSSPQIMTLPQISAAATKLRTVNTTILPPGTKLTAKKLPPTSLFDHTSANQAQVFNIIDGTTTTITTNIPNNAQAATTPTGPTHTPPAIIQLQSSSGSSSTGIGANNSITDITVSPSAQKKVLTKKILPIMLSSGSVTTAAANTITGNIISTSSANITKIETLNNGATIVAASSSALAGAPIGGTIIKSLPSTMLLTNPSVSGIATVGGNSSTTTLISTIGPSGATVFRKPSNIIKTGIIGMGTAGTILGSGTHTTKISGTFNSNTSNSGPQIISNVKLTPAIVTTPISTSTTASGVAQQKFLQHPLKNVPTTALRTSVKICQSPNGKVFIQSANPDPTKTKIITGNLQQKLLTNTLIGSTAGATGVATTSAGPQRIAIQKVQIIPAPMSSPGTIQLQHQGRTHHKPTTLTLSGVGGNKSNMIFMPPRQGALTKSNILSSKLSPTADMSNKTNVVVIGATSLAQAQAQVTPTTPIKTTTFIAGTGNSSGGNTGVGGGSGSGNKNTISQTPTKTVLQLENNQMITEDTPVDILNIPIIVDSIEESNVVVANNIGDTVTVLSNTLIEKATNQLQQTQTSTQAQQQQQQHQAAVILGATDWEMELDQATAVAAATKARTQRRSTSSNTSGNINRQRKSMSERLNQQQPTAQQKSEESATIVIDDTFEDVIVEEQEYEADSQQVQLDDANEETITTTATTTTNTLSPITSSLLNENIIILEDVKENLNFDSTKQSQQVNVEDDPIVIIDDEVEKSTKSVTTTLTATVATNAAAAATDIDTSEYADVSVDCESVAGFDETTDTEIDENTAIEYIEEDQQVTAEEANEKDNLNTNLTTTSSTTVAQSAEEYDCTSTSADAAAAAATDAAKGLIEDESQNNAVTCNTNLTAANELATLKAILTNSDDDDEDNNNDEEEDDGAKDAENIASSFIMADAVTTAALSATTTLATSSIAASNEQ